MFSKRKVPHYFFLERNIEQSLDAIMSRRSFGHLYVFFFSEKRWLAGYDGYTPWRPVDEAATGRLRQIDAQKIQQLEELQMLGMERW